MRAQEPLANQHFPLLRAPPRIAPQRGTTTMHSIWPEETGDEFARRRAAVQQSLHARGVRRLVLTSTDAIYYLTGATCEPLERPVFLFVDAELPDYRLLVPML